MSLNNEKTENIVNTYRSYRNDLLQNSSREKQFLREELQRQIYLKKHSPSQIEIENAFQRGERVLDAINILDDYSQTQAEETESTIKIINQNIIGITMLPIMFLYSFLSSRINCLKKAPSILSVLVPLCSSLLLTIPLSAFGAQLEVKASRNGRAEAIKNELHNHNHFAVFTKEQEIKIGELAKNIEYSQKEKQKNQISFNPIKAFRNLKKVIFSNQEKYHSEKLFYSLPQNITKEEELHAKMDQQLLFRLVKKIDIASQEYAEKAEMLQNIIAILTLIGGVGTGFCAEKLFSKFFQNLNKNIANILSTGVMLVPMFLISRINANLDQEASRVGRFIAIKNLKQNPNNFVYVSPDKLKTVEVSQINNNKTFVSSIKDFCKFSKNIFRDYRDYKNYQKDNLVTNYKRQKAKEKIKLSDKQIEEAKRLQKNVTMIFNKMDDCSQRYSESVEALGEILKEIVNMIASCVFIVLSAILPQKGFKLSKYLSTFGIFVIPSILMELFITREQIKASHCAANTTINELSDYRYFIQQMQPDVSTEENIFKKFESLIYTNK